MKLWLGILSLASTCLCAEEWISEELYKDWKQTFKVDKILYQERTQYQDLTIFENAKWGRVLMLDGAVQITENDEFVYQEMMAHVPLVAHGKAENVLVIGGGDGGILREILKHDEVKHIVLVEIDPDVIRFSKEHLPFICQGSLDDPKVEIVIEDGMEYVKRTDKKFDVILCDSSDPFGPAEVLFTKEFYGHCKKLLTKGGIFVNQAGVPAMQKEELQLIFSNLSPHFETTTFYLGAIPTYVGGFMAFGWATDGTGFQRISKEELQSRIEKIRGKTKYYNVDIHYASFALPNFIQDLLKQ
jgi:spermidine synthase